MAAVVVTKTGQVFVGYSKRAATKLGRARPVSDKIAAAAESARTAIGRGCGAGCAEVEAVSRAVASGVDLAGSTVSASQIGTRGGKAVGAARSTCDSCAGWVPGFLK